MRYPLFHIAICDDSPVQLLKIRTAIEQYFSNQIEYQADISMYDSSLQFLESLDKNAKFDVLLLDICMPGFTGIEIAKEVRKRKDKSEIIFLTSSNEFAVDAFALKAVHYLLKPFTQTQFNEAMNRALTGFSTGQIMKLLFKLEGGGMQAVNLKEILCIESFGHVQCVHLEDGKTLEIRESLSKLLTQLDDLSPGQFISPYKGYIVNLNAIRTIESKGITLHNNSQIPIVRRNFRKISECYFNYTFGKK